MKNPLAKFKNIWLSLPADHRKRFFQSITLYLLIVASISGWLYLNSANTLKTIEERSPKVTIKIEEIKASNAQIASMHSKAMPEASQIEPPNMEPVFDSSKVAFQQKYITIIISSLGLSKSLTENALKEETLPKTFSLAFSPYAHNVTKLIEQAKDAGYETLIHVPMESAEYPEKDPGPKAISTRLSDSKNIENLEWILGRGKGANGVVSFMGSRFLNDKKRLVPAFEKIHQSKYIFIESPTGKKSVAENVASELGLPYIEVDMKIGELPDKNAINKELDRLEEIANTKGYAIGMVTPYPFTFDILKTWSNKLSKHDIILANINTLWRNRINNDKRNYNISESPK